MSTYTSEPGTRLGGRYRLEDRTAAAAGWAAWKAIDEILARAVTVYTFAPGFPRTREVVTAARAASRLNDARVAQVFDVEDDWDHAYIVMEWAAGDTLGDLLAAGPMDPDRGAQIVAEAAGAMAAAHAAGVTHLCLTPESLRWTPGGGVKVIGLGMDAALAGVSTEDPALADTRGLGQLLYAALTGHWPGSDYPSLPPAPTADGLPCSPRQVRAGVPTALDEITCQTLELRGHGHSHSHTHGHGHSEPITTPAELARELSAVIPPVLPPVLTSAPPPLREPDDDPAVTGQDRYWPAKDRRGGSRSRGRRPAGPARGGGSGRAARTTTGMRAALAGAVVLVVIAAVVVTAFSLRKHPAHPTGTQSAPPSQVASTDQTLKPLSAQGFDAYNLSDTGDENSQDALLAIDGDPSTDWKTQFYLSPVFGGLKPGSGLMLDMGKPVRLSSLQIQFGATRGADVKIGLASTDSRSSATVTGMTTVAKGHNLGGLHKFSVHSTATGQYVLIWFTKLPPMGGGKYEAAIYNIVLRGSTS
jgi:hypothetical protein